MPQLPDDENDRLVAPKPPRDVDDVEDVEDVEELGRALLLVCEGDKAVETEPRGRLTEVERWRS